MLIFVVHRSNYYKLFGPLIREAAARGLPVEIWICSDVKGKEYLDPSTPPELLSELPIKRFDSLDALNVALAEADARAIFSLHSRKRYKLSQTGPVFITLQHGIDTFIETDLNGLCDTDYLCVYSDFWIDWGAQYFHEAQGANERIAFMQLKEKAVGLGFPQLDNLHEISPTAVRRKYGISADARVVLYLPITLANINGLWPRFFEQDSLMQRVKTFIEATRRDKAFLPEYLMWLLCGWNDRKLTKAIKAFADNNGAVLIGKARQKDPVRPSLKELADLAIYDESDYPSTTLELLSIADVCIHFYSFAALESAYFGVFGITVDRPSPSADVGEEPPAFHRLWRRSETGTAFNFLKVNKWMTIPEMILGLPGARIEDLKVDSLARRAFVETYLGADDGKASSRILDLVAS